MRVREWMWAAAAVMALAGPATAGAQMAGPGNGMMGGFFQGIGRGGGTPGGPFGATVDMTSVATAWLSALHGALGITPAQEPAWQAFAAAVTEQARAMQSFRGVLLQGIGASAPERAQLALTFMRQRLDAMQDVLDAMAVLYGQLTPAQRALLDAGFAVQCLPWGLFAD